MKKCNMIKTAAAATALALFLCGCFFPKNESLHSPPVITMQPVDRQTKAGETVTFEAAAQGEGLTYQWYYKKPDSSRWSVWNSHDTPVTSAPANPTWNGMRVYCRITDSSGNSVATRAALISLSEPVVMTAQPVDVRLNLGETAYFRVEAKGKGKLKYQWYYRKSNSELWTKWKGHTASDTEAVANNSWNGMQVFCLVTDSAGSSVPSDFATVTVIDSPTVILQPRSTRITQSDLAAFTVNGGTEGLVYQWFYIPAGGFTGVKMMGRNDPTLTLSVDESWNGSQVYCRLKSPGGSMVFSDRAEIISGEKPIITSQPQSVVSKVGNSMKFSVKASGDELRYRWFFRYKNSSGWFPLAGYTTQKISLRAVHMLSGGEIRCEVTDGRGNKAVSQPAQIIVNDQTDIILPSRNVTASSGETVKIRADADTQDVSFRWYVRKSGDFGWKEIAGQTGSEFSGVADPSWHRMQIQCMATAVDGSSYWLPAADITINDIFTLKASPKSITARSGDNAVFSVKAAGRGLNYQWLRKADGSDKWVRWQGQNASSVKLPAETSWHRMTVRCDVTDCTGKQISSDSAGVWITDALDILRQPDSISVRAYELAEFSVKAQGKGLRYQWYYKKRGMIGWNVWKKHTSPSTSALSNPTWDGMRVMCVVTDSEDNKKYSRQAIVRITE